MRSGIWDTWTDDALAAYYADPLHPPCMDEMIARTAAAGDRFTRAGRATVYVNMNFILLDKIIAAVTGAADRRGAAGAGVRPLGMTASALAATAPSCPARCAATAGTPRSAYEDKTELDPGPVGGAGAAISSLADLDVFVRALCTGTLLPPETQAARMRDRALRRRQRRGALRRGGGAARAVLRP